MPRVRLAKIVNVPSTYGGSVPVRQWAEGIMVEDGDRLTVLDPESNNELIKGMTLEFAQRLIRSDMMVMVEAA